MLTNLYFCYCHIEKSFFFLFLFFKESSSFLCPQCCFIVRVSISSWKWGPSQLLQNPNLNQHKPVSHTIVENIILKVDCSPMQEEV